MDYQKLLEKIELEKVYLKKISKIKKIPKKKIMFPIEYLYIDNDKKIELLEEAIQTNKLLQELEYLQKLHYIRILGKLEDGINETRSRMNNRESS